jgi:hypothetical protein
MYFLKAREIATRRVTCYINAGIILVPHFCDAGETVCKMKTTFLMFSRQWNINLERQPDLPRPVSGNQLHAYVREPGCPDRRSGLITSYPLVVSIMITFFHLQ